ncbi:hypothetical protein L6164_022535 [Bauhinia variegata]|uniref:Uncharacterized protein n=1 Tax=Bauhinia variegata TaxID=167791 RepID=A0ACB9MHE4_BAUVA|nr:hypothetical protein L6164_022535 [Bauhinia variegata]
MTVASLVTPATAKAVSTGLATTLALLGIGASFAAKAYGQIGQGLPLAASGLSIIMGLNLLEVLYQAEILDSLEIEMWGKVAESQENMAYLIFAAIQSAKLPALSC